jgi:hypothetical protein
MSYMKQKWLEQEQARAEGMSEVDFVNNFPECYIPKWPGGIGQAPTPPKPDPVEAEPPEEFVEVLRFPMVQGKPQCVCLVCCTLFETSALPFDGIIKNCPECGVSVLKRVKVAKYIRNRKP